MCYLCHDPWCEYPGEGCFPEDYPEFQYLTPEGLDLIANPPAFVSESEYNNMSKKVEVEVEKDADKNGIITKQSEVYVWNDTVFASYKSALAASKRSKIIDMLCERQFSKSAGYPATQTASYRRSMLTNPASCSFSGHHVLDVIAELLAE